MVTGDEDGKEKEMRYLFFFCKFGHGTECVNG
jgi:hypothetical protein